MPTMIITSTPTRTPSMVQRFFAALAALPPLCPPPDPAAIAAASGPHCPVVSIMLLPHPRRPHLQVAHFAGGCVVVPRGVFKDFELAVFLPEGAELPDYLLKRANLWDYTSGFGVLRGPNRNRVALRRVDGVLSYGVLLKVINVPTPQGDKEALVFSFDGVLANGRYFTEKECAGRFLGVQ